MNYPLARPDADSCSSPPPWCETPAAAASAEPVAPRASARSGWRRLLAAALLLAAPAFALAADGQHALLIGISAYAAESKAEPLPGVPVDLRNARRMAEGMGVPASAITELRDGDATKERILEELARLERRVQPGDRVLIYFSGHGTRMETADGCEEGLSTYTGEMLTEGEIARYTGPLGGRADKMLFMVDACFSGGVLASPATRSLAAAGMRPRVSRAASACVPPVNHASTRSLLAEMRRLGQPEENVVQIAAASRDEVSWDNERTGGVATAALSHCLLGGAPDMNRSGAVSLEEIRACAQARMDDVMRPYRSAGMLPSTLQVRGNRNLVVAPAVAGAEAPVEGVAAAPATPALPQGQPQAAAPAAPPPAPSTPAAPASVVAVNAVAAAEPAPAPTVPVGTAVPTEAVTATATPSGAGATLDDLFQQRDPRRQVAVKTPARMKIGRDEFRFEVTSSAPGYLYAVMLGSDGKSLYLLFPNRLDGDNRLEARKTYSFPRPGWRAVAAGPAGTDKLLFVVSQSPRLPEVFRKDATGDAGPFAYAVADEAGRRRLVDFLLGRGVQGRNRSLGAALVDVEEVE